MTSMQRRRDVIGGLIVMTIGTGFLTVGSDLDMGSSFRMGPGYFPNVLSVVMILLGLAITGLALRSPKGEGGSTPLPWRGLLLILGAAVFFGFVLVGRDLLREEFGVGSEALPLFSGDTFSLFTETLSELFGGFDVAWIAFAVYTAWRIPAGQGFGRLAPGARRS